MPNAVWFVGIAFGIPILIVAQAVLRNWLRWRRPRASLQQQGHLSGDLTYSELRGTQF